MPTKNEELSLYFPYPKYREGQKKAISDIFDNVLNNNHVILEARNGFGKTITVLSSIVPYAKERGLKIVYLCRTHTQSSRVIEELKSISTHLKKKNIVSEIGALGLRGRQALCFHPLIVKEKTDAATSQMICQQLRKFKKCEFFNNMKKKKSNVNDLISQISSFPMDGYDLIKICEVWELCPYLISQKALAESEITLIACNYQWIVNPHIREIFLEAIGSDIDETILVIDEAHNFPDVAINMASQELSLFSIDQMMKEAEDVNFPKAVQFGKVLSKILEDFGVKFKNQNEIAVSPELILNKIQKKLGLSYLEAFMDQLIYEGEEIRKEKIKLNQNPRSYLFNVGNFWKYWIRMMQKDPFFYCISKYYTRSKNQAAKFELVCLDPTEVTNPFLKKVPTSINLSGTLNTAAYLDVLSLPETTKIINLPSPFTRDQFQVYVTEHLTTRNVDRTREMYEKIVEKCLEVISETPKNIGIFAASYRVVSSMMELDFENRVMELGKKFFREKPDFKAKDNDKMIKKFKDSAKKSGAVLLGVCGGRNAEGEDFPGDLMNAVIVVGIPFATPSLKSNSMIDYYAKIFNDKQKGKDLGYNNKAFQRASQAAGRSMRTINDKAVVVLMDKRYNNPYFNRLLSNWLKDNMEVIPDEPNVLKDKISKFWASENL